MSSTGGRYDREHTGAIRKIRAVIVLLVLLAGLFVFVFGLTLNHDADMEPGYREGQPVFFLRLGSVRRGDVAVIKAGMKHAIKAIDGELHIIEVQIGDELTEDDIERIDWDW